MGGNKKIVKINIIPRICYMEFTYKSDHYFQRNVTIDL